MSASDIAKVAFVAFGAGFVACIWLAVFIERGMATDLCKQLDPTSKSGTFKFDETVEPNVWRLVCQREEWK